MGSLPSVSGPEDLLNVTAHPLANVRPARHLLVLFCPGAPGRAVRAEGGAACLGRGDIRSCEGVKFKLPAKLFAIWLPHLGLAAAARCGLPECCAPCGARRSRSL